MNSIVIPGLTPERIEALPARKKAQVIEILQAIRDRRKYNWIESLYPDTGPLRRELYHKHMEFFAAGKHYQERTSLSGNRCGKTLKGAFETTLHLTGEYPDWWPGRRFDHPVSFWVAGNTGETTRDIVQKMLMGPPNDFGSGMIPKSKIIKYTPAAGSVSNALDTVWVEYKGGEGVSDLGFKAYSRGRKSFEGTEKDGIWYDEECPTDVYAEGLMRVSTTQGIVFNTFTPLQGLTELVLSFLPQEYSFSEAA